jgi:DNA polymerase
LAICEYLDETQTPGSLVGTEPRERAEEDRLGEPFVGRSGQLLDRLLADAGIDGQREAYFVNGVKCRPPQNRRPSAQELAACWPWLEQQIRWVDPALLLLVGARGKLVRICRRQHPRQQVVV